MELLSPVALLQLPRGRLHLIAKLIRTHHSRAHAHLHHTCARHVDDVVGDIVDDAMQVRGEQPAHALAAQVL